MTPTPAREPAACPAGIIPVDQVPGDGLCLQACLATLLGMPLDAMPRYDRSAKGHEVEFIEQRRQINRWLERECGLTLVLITDFLDIDQCSDPRTLAIASGPSPRQRGGHACVVSLSRQIVHDPHPDRTGFKDGRIDALEVLVPLARHAPPPTPAGREAAERIVRKVISLYNERDCVTAFPRLTDAVLALLPAPPPPAEAQQEAERIAIGLEADADVCGSAFVAKMIRKRAAQVRALRAPPADVGRGWVTVTDDPATWPPKSDAPILISPVAGCTAAYGRLCAEKGERFGWLSLPTTAPVAPDGGLLGECEDALADVLSAFDSEMTVKVKAVRIERWTDLLARLRARPSVEYDSQWADRYEPGIAKQAGAVRENLGRLGLLHPDAVACSVDVAIHDALLRVRAAARAQEGKA